MGIKPNLKGHEMSRLPALLAFVPTLAYGQAALTPYNAAALPPAEYDRPYNGPLIVIRGDEKLMRQMCPRTKLPITLGCQYFIRMTGTETPEACVIVVANDEILKTAGWPYEIIKTHERAHCNGWPKDHPGQRKATEQELKRIILQR